MERLRECPAINLSIGTAPIVSETIPQVSLKVLQRWMKTKIKKTEIEKKREDRTPEQK